MDLKIPWATLTLVALVLASYFYFGAEPYASSQALGSFGLASWNVAGAFTSEFMHQGVRHLLANLIPLAAFALLLESTMSGAGVLAIFFASGAAGGLVYLLLSPGALVIGASAANSGLMAACAALKPRAAIALAIAVVLVSVFAVIPLAEQFAESRKTQLQNQVDALAIQSERASSAAEEAAAAASESEARLAELKAAGDVQGAAAEQAVLAEKAAEFKAAREREAQAREAFASAQDKAEEFAVGEAHESVPSVVLPHAVGALVGLALVLAFRKSDVDENIRSLKSWLVGLRGRS